MTSIVSRELSITYNSYTVGGDQANRILHGVHMIERDYEKGVLEFTFVIRHTDNAAFVNECLAAERAFRTPRQDTVVSQSGVRLIDWSQSQSTGYNAMPHLTKEGDEAIDGGFARKYRARIEVGIPADTVGTSLRRYSFINVAYSPSRRRTVTISGIYTANGSTSARSQYQSVFDAFATSVLNTLGGTYKKLEEPQSTGDDTGKELNFSVTYEEIIYTGVGAGDTSLRGEQLTITRARSTPGDTPGPSTVERLIHLTAIYEAWFDNTVTTAIEAKWETLRSSVLSAIQGVLTGGSVGVIDERPSYDKTNNKITVTLECVGSTTNGLLEYRETVANDIFLGKVLIGVMNGDYLAKYKFTGPGKFQRTISQEFTTINGQDPPLYTDHALEPPANPGGGTLKMELMTTHRSRNPIRWGLPNYSQRIDAIKVVYVRVFEFYTEPQDGVATPGGGGGGGPIAGGSPGSNGDVATVDRYIVGNADSAPAESSSSVPSAPSESSGFDTTYSPENIRSLIGLD